jgi:hypothetical protein
MKGAWLEMSIGRDASRSVGADSVRSAFPPAAPVGDHELAPRLSYCLWSSLPDAALLREAEAGRLHEPVVFMGRAGARIASGRVLDYASQENRQICRLSLSIMEKMGGSQPAFGDATTPLAEV